MLIQTDPTCKGVVAVPLDSGKPAKGGQCVTGPTIDGRISVSNAAEASTGCSWAHGSTRPRTRSGPGRSTRRTSRADPPLRPARADPAHRAAPGACHHGPVLLVSANVNGIRAAARRGGVTWLEAAAPDVVTLQEVRADDDQLAAALAGSAFEHWHVAHARCSVPGRSGVAVLSRRPFVEVRTDVGEEFAGSGRWVEADVVVDGADGADGPEPW